MKSSTSFEAGGSRYTIEHRGGREIHREARLDHRGKVLAEVEAEVAYALGSGSRGISYLVEHDGRLYQSPISWFSQKARWDLSPGYERDNVHFSRPIEPSCLFCHANHVEPVEHAVNRYREPTFRGHAIGCERCHGPGELHLRGQRIVGERDTTIVNPRHLEPALRDAVCEQCHLLGDYRVDRLGRGTFDYRPGQMTSDYYLVFGRAVQGGTKAVGHVEQMKASRCYRESKGELGCISCHDPHQVPAPGERVEYFRRQCLACHERQGCSLPRPARLARSPEDDCTRCHMPRIASTDITHVAATDHRVLRDPSSSIKSDGSRPQAGLPLAVLNVPEGNVPGAASSARELGIALAVEGPHLPDTPEVRRLAVYILSLLDSALGRHPDDAEAKRLKAQVLALSGRRALAIQLVDELLGSVPDDEKALDDYLTYVIDSPRAKDALEPARRAVALNPWSAVWHERLAYVSLERGDWETTLQQARAALELDPFLRFSRMFVVQCLLRRGDRAGATAEFASLVALHPDFRPALERWFAQEAARPGS